MENTKESLIEEVANILNTLPYDEEIIDPYKLAELYKNRVALDSY